MKKKSKLLNFYIGLLTIQTIAQEQIITTMSTRGNNKRGAEVPSTPPRGNGAPKKAKTPPIKDKSKQIFANGQTFEVRYTMCKNGWVLYWVCDGTDANDAYMRFIASDYLKDANHELTKIFNIKGEGGRRISVSQDVLLKNTKNRWTRHVFMAHQPDGDNSFMTKCAKAIKKAMESNNPYNNEYVLLESTLNQTPESGPGMMDEWIENKDIVKAMKTIYSIETGWANEYHETLEEYFHETNRTPYVKESLGFTDHGGP